MWKPYTSLVNTRSVQGELLVAQAVYSPQLDNDRDVSVWLPPSYAKSTARYPVLYMHDGQNLFDAEHSYSGEWQVDETMMQLATEGYEAIIVGVPNIGAQRFSEYNPYPGWNRRGQGSAYIDFLTQTIKPWIDREFRTQPSSSSTGIAGSSMGGLISLYGFLMRPAVFGLCGSFSPVFWLGTEKLHRAIQARTLQTERVYLDVGTNEGEVIANHSRTLHFEVKTDPDDAYCDGVSTLHDAFVANNEANAERVYYVEEAGAPHHESAWARRLPDALRFLLADLKQK